MFTYYSALFNGSTWAEFQSSGSKIIVFRESRWQYLQKLESNDYLVCYLIGLSRIIGIFKVIGKAFKNEEPIWQDELYSARINVQPIIELTPETAIPVHELKNDLGHQEKPYSWRRYFRASVTKIKTSHGDAIVQALMNEQKNPIKKPFNQRKLNYRPEAIKTNTGSVTVPDSEPDTHTKGPSEHTEIQWLLLKFGLDMGLNVWVARNDRSKEYHGKRFSDLPKLKDKLPLQFPDEAGIRTAELIDVIWLDGNNIVAAFEIESTTSIYSGLLRMADLVAMYPNLNVALYLVAPDDRRNKVMTEINRPTFARLSTPLSEVCRYLSFSVLKDHMKNHCDVNRFVKSEILEELSEICELGET